MSNRSKHARRGRRWSVLRRRARTREARAWIRALIVQDRPVYPLTELGEVEVGMQQAIRDALFSAEKVPYTDAGIEMITKAIDSERIARLYGGIRYTPSLGVGLGGDL